MYKLTITYDKNKTPDFSWQYSDELEAHKAFANCVDWGFANKYSTVNLYTSTGKCYTKIFYREGRRVVEK